MTFLNYVLLTIDTDWAPDFAIEFVAEQLISRRVRATWFITHVSPAITRLQDYPHLFELGIHPNFRPGSTHGNTPEEVLHHCMSLVPDATSMRTHSLVQSSPLLDLVMTQTSITTDVSLFLPRTPYLRPVEYWRGKRCLLRIPYYWEDDFEMERPDPCWHLAPLLNIGPGLKVFDFHPIHVYLNSFNMQSYRELLSLSPDLAKITSDQAAPHVQSSEGTRDLYLEVVDYLASSNESLLIKDITSHWQASVLSTNREEPG